jgi:hypothetical protein
MDDVREISVAVRETEIAIEPSWSIPSAETPSGGRLATSGWAPIAGLNTSSETSQP